MTSRGWWISGAVATAAIICGGFWADQVRVPATAAACTSCDARHQNLAGRQGALAQTASGALTPPFVMEPVE